MLIFVIYKQIKLLVMKLFIELHEEQGGLESKLLVDQMADIYQKSANHLNIACEAVD